MIDATGLMKESEQFALYNEEAEKGCLGSMMLVSMTTEECRAIVKPEQFRQLAHQHICRAIYKLRDQGSELDPLIVSAELERAGQLENVGGDLYLGELMDSTPHAAHAEYYAREVVKWWKRRTIAFATARVNRSCYNPTIDEHDLVSELAEAVEEANRDEARGATSLRDATLRVMDKLDPDTPKEPPLSTGLCDLDETLTGGLRKKAMYVLAARPGTGKTALACDLVENIGAAGVYFACMEMPEIELTERLVSIKTGIPFTDITQSKLTSSQRESVAFHMNALAALPVFIDDRTSRTVPQLKAACRTHSLRNPLRVLIVDYLQLLAPDNAKDSREQQVAKMAVGLKNLAMELDITVIALCQLSREIEKRSDRRPHNSDLRDSGVIEQAADVVMFLDRPSVYDDSAEKSEAGIYVTKNRHGATGQVPLFCDMATLTFKNASKLTGPMEPDYFDEWNH